MTDSSTLAELVNRLVPTPGIVETEWPGLVVFRIVEPMARTPVVYTPCLCVVAQGEKYAYLGDQTYQYNPDSYLLCSLPLPIESEIKSASTAAPLLGLVLRFDPSVAGAILLEMDEYVAWPDSSSQPAIAPCPMSSGVHRAITRLLEAVASPMERRILGPGLQREFLFEVLRGENGHLLREFVLRDSRAHRVSRVVSYLEKNFRENLDIKRIAQQAGMSPSALHDHFKRTTSLSPMQFVKRMRLHEARALLLGGRGASETAFEVGYSSPSQFSREFRRMFGQSPSRLRAAAEAPQGI